MSTLNLDIENLFSPQSVVQNSIGFVTLLAGYTNTSLTPPQTFTKNYTLTGSMTIGLTNVFLKVPQGFWLPLTSLDPGIGNIGTSGDNVKIKYSLALP